MSSMIIQTEKNDDDDEEEMKRKRDKKEKKKRKRKRSHIDDDEKEKKKKKKKKILENLENGIKNRSPEEQEDTSTTINSNSSQQDQGIIIQTEVADAADPLNTPIVVSFPGGCNNSGSTTTSLPIEFHSYQRTPHSTRGLKLIGTDEKCTYTSSNEGRAYDNRRTKTLVGVYCVQEQKLVLHLAAEKGTVFPMQQYVTSTTTTNNNTNEFLSWDARTNELYGAFGSSKKQKFLKSAAANKIEVSSVVDVNIPTNLLKAPNTPQRKITTIQQQQYDTDTILLPVDPVEEALEESRRQLLPPFDKTAIMPYLVYNAKSIAEGEAWGDICRTIDACLGKRNDWVKALIESRKATATMYSSNKTSKDDTPHTTWPGSLVALVNSLKEETQNDRKKIKKRLRIILLLHHVIKFHLFANKRQFRQETNEEMAKLLSIPIEVCDRLLEIFATPMDHGISGRPGFAFTKQLKEKRIVYALLLYVMAHGETMMVSSMASVMDDMELNLTLASKLLGVAGCNVKKNPAGNDISVALTVPLYFPRSKGKGGSAKR